MTKVVKQRARQAPIKRVEVLGPLTALADDTRLRILEMLAEGEELRAQDLIARLNVSQPNASRHLKQLTGAGLVTERRAGDANKWYQLSLETVDRLHQTMSQLLTPENARVIREMEGARAELLAAQQSQPAELHGVLDASGRVAHWPRKLKDQDVVIEYLAAKLARGHEYTEKELGVAIKAWVREPDAAYLRRTMFEKGLINRTPNGSKYWRVG